MKPIHFTMALLVATPVFAGPGHRPHLDPQATSAEYRTYLAKEKKSGNKLKLNVDLDPDIERSIKLGERLAEWVNRINEGRTPETAIRLTSPETRISYPIDRPNKYNPKILAAEALELEATMPKEMVAVIWGNAEIPADTQGVDDKTFAVEGRKLDRNYQGAARYKSLNPWREEYKWAAAADVRGYYYLTKNNIQAADLKDVSSIETAKLELIKEALYRTCRNYEGSKETQCQEVVDQSTAENALAELYEFTFPAAKANWDSFFKIPVDARRKDILWVNDIMTVPFNTPTIAKFIPYLQDNIEDEFRFASWAMKINFGTFDDGPRLEFKAGEVPHVNGLGGNIITMDSNQPIEEYESRWTIRHEFGHVIGLPDCYHEFFDTKLDAYVNYQLDVTDLMCSRAGNMNERIFNELKEAYAPVAE
jgi:hypothetical protein